MADRERCYSSIHEVTFEKFKNLVRCAHNWNDGIMECWNNGYFTASG
jgi:hypothetical protein